MQTEIHVYLTHMRLQGASDGYLTATRDALLTLARALLVAVLSDATAGQLLSWRASLAVGPETIINYVGYARRFYDWAITAGRCAANPAAAIPVPRRPSRLARPIPTGELLDVLAAAPAGSACGSSCPPGPGCAPRTSRSCAPRTSTSTGSTRSSSSPPTPPRAAASASSPCARSRSPRSAPRTCRAAAGHTAGHGPRPRGDHRGVREGAARRGVGRLCSGCPSRSAPRGGCGAPGKPAMHAAH